MTTSGVDCVCVCVVSIVSETNEPTQYNHKWKQWAWKHEARVRVCVSMPMEHWYRFWLRSTEPIQPKGQRHESSVATDVAF